MADSMQQIYIGGKSKKKVGKAPLASGARKKEKRSLKSLQEKNEEINEKRMLKRV